MRAKKYYREMSLTKGFTLVELVVVIAIIAILTSVGLVSYTDFNRRARDARRKADLEVIRQALELYRADNGVYPDGGWWGSAYQTDWATFQTAIGTDHISQLPVDPINNATGNPGPCGTEGSQRYNYRSISSGQGYILTAIMEDESSNDGNECHLLPNWGTNCSTQTTQDVCYGTQNP